jgi:hypothetical protein
VTYCPDLLDFAYIRESKAKERRRKERGKAGKARIYIRGLYISRFLRQVQKDLGAS